MSLNFKYLGYNNLMRRITLIVFMLISFPIYANEVYRVTIKRVSQDLYEDTLSHVVIQTQYCYEYVYFDESVLIDSGFAKKLVFSNGNTCDVKRLLK